MARPTWRPGDWIACPSCGQSIGLEDGRASWHLVEPYKPCREVGRYVVVDEHGKHVHFPSVEERKGLIDRQGRRLR